MSRLAITCALLPLVAGCYLSHARDGAGGGDAGSACALDLPAQGVAAGVCTSFERQGGDECSVDPETTIRVQTAPDHVPGFTIHITPTSVDPGASLAGYTWRDPETCLCPGGGARTDRIIVGEPFTIRVPNRDWGLALLGPGVTYRVEFCTHR